MGTAPIDRDTQIALMQNAAKRHQDRVERWKNDETVQRVLRERAEHTENTYDSSNHRLKMKNCA